MGPLPLVLPGKKLRHRDVKELAQGHTAGSALQRLSSNPWATPFSTSLASRKGIDGESCPEKCQNRGPDCSCPLGPLWVFSQIHMLWATPATCLGGRTTQTQDSLAVPPLAAPTHGSCHTAELHLPAEPERALWARSSAAGGGRLRFPMH